MTLEGYNGNGQPDPRYQSGAAPGQSTEPRPLRDWQKDTWYGAAPSDGNPFDEQDNAPELLKERSENLNDHQGDFWQQQTTGYQFRAGNTTERDARAGSDKSRGKVHPIRIGLSVLAALALVFAAVYYGIYQLTDIQVVGNSAVSEDAIIAASGLKMGSPILGIDAGTVARRIENNPHLKFMYLEKRFPGTVIIRVKEREECCWMTWCGIYYTMDKHRRILSETEDQSVQLPELVKVDGLGIRSGCMIGQTLVLENAKQEEVFSNLFLEMKVLKCTELVEEADLSNLYSILLTTRDGFTVSMGDYENLHAKLRSMLLTREELLRMGYNSGVINVIVPEYPVFSPGE